MQIISSIDRFRQDSISVHLRNLLLKILAFEKWQTVIWYLNNNIIMATTTATILIGQAHPNHGGINPTHFIRFTENDRPALILQAIDEQMERKVIIPTVEDTVNDIYLMIAVFILKKVTPSKEIHTLKKKSLYEILDKNERLHLYSETRKIFEELKIKIVFNILDDSHLLNQVDIIKSYPNDFEVTLPALKKEYDAWANKIITKGF